MMWIEWCGLNFTMTEWCGLNFTKRMMWKQVVLIKRASQFQEAEKKKNKNFAVFLQSLVFFSHIESYSLFI